MNGTKGYKQHRLPALVVTMVTPDTTMSTTNDNNQTHQDMPITVFHARATPSKSINQSVGGNRQMRQL